MMTTIYLIDRTYRKILKLPKRNHKIMSFMIYHVRNFLP